MRYFKPQGYNAVSPYLVVKGAQKMKDFLIEVFEGVEQRSKTNEDGVTTHTEVKIDDSIIMIGNAMDQHPPKCY